MNYSEAFGGAGGGAVLDYQPFTSSQQYTVPFDGLLDLLALAGNGSGALGAAYVSGAGAGEVAYSRAVRVYKGDVLTVTIGLGGNPITWAGGADAAGNAGGDTVITSSRGWAITVKGGQGGKVGPNSAQLPGALGGRGGTGAQIHIPGGNGGDILIAAGGAGVAATKVTGGGAPNLRGAIADLVRGGNIVFNTGSLACTGGAGVGGHGGDVTAAGANVATSGGGYGGSAADGPAAAAAAGVNALGARAGASPMIYVPGLAGWGLDYFGGGGFSGGNTANNTPAGGGSAGNSNTATFRALQALTAFGGGGAEAIIASAASLIMPDAPVGCTSSSAYVQRSSTYTITSGRGGQGIAVFVLRKG